MKKYENNQEILDELVEKMQENNMKYNVKVTYTDNVEKGNTISLIWRRGYRDEVVVAYFNDISFTQQELKELFDCEEAFKNNQETLKETAKENEIKREEKFRSELVNINDVQNDNNIKREEVLTKLRNNSEKKEFDNELLYEAAEVLNETEFEEYFDLPRHFYRI